jgi:two-component system nitrogen regulation response regulator GlnG
LALEPDSPALEIAAWADVFHRFLSYQWPGNIRQLANFASQLVLAADGGCTLPENIRRELQGRPAAEATAPAGNGSAARRNIRDIQEPEFERALRASRYEVAPAARELDVSRQAVYRRMDESPRYRLAGQVPLPELERALAAHNGDATAAALDLQVSLSGLRSRLRDSGLAWH